MTIRSRRRPGAVVTGLLAAVLAAGPVGAAVAADPVVLDHGHIDAFSVSVEGGELALELTEDVTGSHVSHAPEDVLLRVKQDAWTTGIPEGYPGAPEGYVLPLTQDPNLIWPGWDTGGTAGSGYTDVSIHITAVDGPGEVFLYSLSSFGEPLSVLTNGGFELPGIIREKTPTHTHGMWTFTAPGAYTLTVRAEAVNPATGDALESRTASYAFSVGDYEEPPPAATGLTIEGLADRYQPGDAVELTAVPDEPTELDDYRWYTRESPAGEWAEVPDTAGPRYSGTAEVDGQQIRAALLGPDGTVAAESPPVTIRVGEEPGGGNPPGQDPDPDPSPAPDPGNGASGGPDPGTTGGTGGTASTGGGTGSGAPACYPSEEQVTTEVPVGPDHSVVLDHGHIDAFSVAAEGGELTLQLAEDVTGSRVTHDPEDVLLHVTPQALTEDIPDGYPGSPSGYLLPLTQDPELLWPGWDTQGTAGSGYTDVSIEITDVTGPGTVHLYTTTTFGGAAPLLVEGDYELPGTLREETPAHTHAQWTFTEAGLYTLTVNAVATDPDTGESISSGPKEYDFAVGDLPDDTETETVTETVVVGRTADGAECDLPGDGMLPATGTGTSAVSLTALGAALAALGFAVVVTVRRHGRAQR
ncbi:choice-of-anchor M domain-containing protein [Streptomyces litchfieldiae]|uniref:Choice-of-anchor M domain-containing protein n=1 Tax=Streptomyces litchfieldiae TaxID=3075543 RepID=A0ABU2MX31_9ACTN|nr:choice-of-anchor M domain-containing protein [Streptomyces sp. DSM 44938]MDT0346202.1 choice-of-anchor M domain-containing protein [Streptomyces sp. DSM 44938]